MGTGTVRAGTAEEAAERRYEQRGWYVYDWACSVYSTSVLTVFLGPYLTSVAKSAADADGSSPTPPYTAPRSWASASRP